MLYKTVYSILFRSSIIISFPSLTKSGRQVEIKYEKKIKVVIAIIGVLLVLLSAFVGWVYFSTFQPDQVQSAPVTTQEEAPLISENEEIKLLSWNIQYMAGKGYHFYYEGGTDKRPSPESINRTTRNVARIIKEEDPDIVLLQEIDEGLKRTDHEDQLEKLLAQLPDEYRSHTSGFYWKPASWPNLSGPGSVGIKLSTIAKYKIETATRYQLPQKSNNWFARQFGFKRTVLGARLPREEGKDLLVFNTHLTAFPSGAEVRVRQVKKIHSLLKATSSEGNPWVIGGDFNLEPPVSSMEREEVNAIKLLFDNYQAVGPYEEINGSNPDWYTHFPNDPEIMGPNKTIDYFFLPDSLSLSLGKRYVRQKDTLEISDHLPMIAKVSLPVK